MKTILLVEDKRGMRVMLSTALKEDGWQVTAVSAADAALKHLKTESYSAVLTDVLLPGRYNGIDVLDSTPSGTPVIVMTAFGTIDMAVDAMKKGAADFVSKPFKLDEILEKLSSVASDSSVSMLGRSSVYIEALKRAERAAPSGMNILIMGESGTGKELLARRIHQRSGRKSGPFVPVNCAAIPENLMESELFGAEKGAYTGSTDARPGRFTIARGGTIFLDEIADLDMTLQGKLLRVLESGTYHSVGGTEEQRSDALVIAASNRDLSEMVEKHKFRQDLYFRISEFPVNLPPLRDRGDDVALIAKHYLELYNGSSFTEGALRSLRNYSWPGNIRELKNIVRRACVNSGEKVITEEMLEFSGKKPEGSLVEQAAAAARAREKILITSALAQSGGNRRKASEILGVSYRTLLTKIKDLQIAVE
ncbi:MAG: sigma-54-dependent Fis family transcriptional regulator [Candidatus Fermentibacteraceae bacterium]|nr:sigma-54-dependent Fis family transcriptional regulator [Candidatus Fermentibacteraceae bacterium]